MSVLDYSGPMLRDRTDILVVGGGSRIALALMALLGERAACIGRRDTGRPHNITVDDYDMIPPSAFGGRECVINCVGTSTGNAAHLNRVNVDMAHRFACAAKAAGARHFIHISSFSVYGGARVVEAQTRPAPTNDYGRSKLVADTALLALADERFAVTIVRLPLIYGHDSLGKLGQVLRIWARMRVFPVPAGDVARAMIGVPLSAEVIARLSETPRTGIVFAADPQPFTYARAARARSELLRKLFIPRRFTRLFERAVPSIGARLFADSRLADVDNLAISYNLASRLYHDIAVAELG